MDEEEGTTLFAHLLYLADSLVSDFDIVDLATHLVEACHDLLPISSAGIMLDDRNDRLRVLASSTEAGEVLELMELQNNEGPCLDAFRTGELISATGSAISGRWPSFGRLALDHGLIAAYAVPLRLRAQTIGALNIFSRQEELSEHELAIARVLADMATIGILNHRNLRDQEILAEQLQAALNSRVAIEQAKGALAERLGVSTAIAFEALRSAARASRRPIVEVAIDVVARGGRLEGRAAASRQGRPRYLPPSASD